MNGVSLTAQYENESSILCTVGSGQVSVDNVYLNNVVRYIGSGMKRIAVHLFTYHNYIMLDQRSRLPGVHGTPVATKYFKFHGRGSRLQFERGHCSREAFLLGLPANST